jgi:predicted lipoprotein with Yx(FWY)xxD motif
MRQPASPMLSAIALLVVGCGFLAIGCGNDDGDKAATSDAPPAQAKGTAQAEETTKLARSDAAQKASRGKTIAVVDSDYGRVIADGRGEAFYLFDKESTKKAECYGECARVWPPVLTQGAPRAGAGVDSQLLGTTKRKNGKRQVTYKGHPLYYYVDDSPGTILCQDVSEFGGLWLVVKPSGNPVT